MTAGPPYDVVVAGLGGFGSASAYHLARRGLRVLGVDPNPAGHQLGSSHGDSRIVRRAYFEGAGYLPLLRRTAELWDELSRDCGEELLVRSGVLFIGDATGRIFAGSLATAEAEGIRCEALSGAELARRYPAFGAVDGIAALLEPEGGVVRPERAVAAHLGLAAAEGAELRHDTALESFEATAGGGVRVRTSAGVVEAGALVVAPGRWAPELLGDLGLPLRPERRVVHWYAPEVAGSWGPARLPAWIWDLPGVSPFGTPDLGLGPKVGIHHCDDRAPEDWTADQVADLIAPLLPGLGGRAVTSQPCWYTMTPDEAFVVGPHPAHERVFLACGFSGHGFKFTPVIGEQLAGLVADGRSRLSLAMFDPARFAA